MSILKYIKLILKAPIRYSLYFISGLIPRNKNIWVFGSFDEAFKDNSRYLYQYLVKNSQLGVRAIWISNKQETIAEVQKYGEAYLRWSIQGIYFSLIAKVYNFSVGIQDVNFFTSRGAVLVNLWHGIPIKKVGFDAFNSLHLRKYLIDDVNSICRLWKKIKYPMVYVKYDFVLSPSQYVADYSFKSAFRVEDKNIIVAEYPRVTYLKQCEPLDEYKQYSKVFLYAPTWRDDGVNFLEKAQIDFVKLNSMMREFNAIFLMKFHYATKIDIDLSIYENIVLLPNGIDPISLMKTADCLITDYSSIYLDYLVLDRPIIHFAFDLDSYISTSRELYFEYDTVLAGLKVLTYTELHNTLLQILCGDDTTQFQRKQLRSKFLAEENRGVEEIVDVILQKVNGNIN